MGGAERSARKKRQQQRTAGSKAVASARASGTDRTKIIVGVVVVLLLAGAVIGGVLYTNAQKNNTEGQTIAPQAVSANYPVSRDGAVVVAGKPDAKVTIDLYEDFLCPACRAFETANGQAIEEKLVDGTLRVRYHMLAILNNQSDPPGYSLDAANAGLCAADGNKFPAFHKSLFGQQPEEGARGYDNAQLVGLGTGVGITGSDFQSCVDSGRYDAEIQAAEQQATSAPNLQQDFNGRKGFGTPTVAVGEKLVDTSDPQWLDKLVSAG